MKNEEKKFLWGKKFCHEIEGASPIHIANKNSTYCNIAMLGNNYADQNKDKENCQECIDAFEKENQKEEKIKKEIDFAKVFWIIESYKIDLDYYIFSTYSEKIDWQKTFVPYIVTDENMIINSNIITTNDNNHYVVTSEQVFEFCNKLRLKC